jgi:hypothetical protein
MMRSMNEVQSLVYKAGRAAGLPLANVEDLVGALPFYFALEGRVSGIFYTLVGAEAEKFERALVQGIAVIDLVQADGDQIAIEALDAPLIFAALVARANSQGARIELETSDQNVCIKIGGPAQITPAQGPVDVRAQDWAALEKLAAKTYVPSSDASRLAGAGAGLNDND